MKIRWSWFCLVCVGCSRVAGADMPHERRTPISSVPAPSATTMASMAPLSVTATTMASMAPLSVTAPAPTNKNPEPTDPIEVVALDPDQHPATFVLRSPQKQPIVFLAGLCGHALYYVQAFQQTAARHGRVVAPQGETPCGAGPYSTLSGDMKKLDRRIVEGFARLALSEPQDVVLIGYSLGATYAQSLARLFPDRYTRLVLIAAPAAPTPWGLKGVKRTVMLAGSLDRKDLMRRGATGMQQAGIASSFLELPGARHGEMGTDAERVMDEALRRVLE